MINPLTHLSTKPVPGHEPPAHEVPGHEVPGHEIQQQVDSVGRLLSSLDDLPSDPQCPQTVLENRLVCVRLGIASSLFHCLRVRHTPTANHSLRVALLCSDWALATELDGQERDELEVAALLHDIGKIGTPDSVLQKPGKLDQDDVGELMSSRLKSLEILSSCASNTNIPKIVAYAGAWFDGQRSEFQLSGNRIPIASRMIAIADAYDAMTTDRIYRKAISPEAALAELKRSAGTQFDPILVDHFAKVLSRVLTGNAGKLAGHWLRSLDPEQSNRLWQLGLPQQDFQPQRPKDVFHEKLMGALPDGILYVNAQAVIMEWNEMLQRMTGVSGESVCHTRWDPYIVKMRCTMTGETIRSEECPVLESLKTGVNADHRVLIKSSSGEHIPVNLVTVPIFDSRRSQLGVAAIFRDATKEANLHRRVATLHKRATLDPLTQLANRAEFDRFHGESIHQHAISNQPSSLIICDIDRFKSINDKYGHQAGDEALVSFARILESHCREGDLVARYGGEEFVMVCQTCSATRASEIAEHIRKDLSVTPLKELGNQCITASFGVTELQPGDTMETMLRRADRGLLEAKDTGRNRVVCLGSGMEESADDSLKGKSNWWSWIAPEAAQDQHPITECYLATNVPIPIVSEKLRGFIADHDATIASADDQKVVLELRAGPVHASGRRRVERSSNFIMTIGFKEVRDQPRSDKTIIHVLVGSGTRRDRRATEQDAARSLIRSLKSYLVAQYHVESTDEKADE